MKKPNIFKTARLLIAGLIVFGFLAIPTAAFAQGQLGCTPGDQDAACNPGGTTTPTPKATEAESSAACRDTETQAALNACIKQSPIVADLQVVVNFISALVGLVVIGSIMLGGIQYITGGGDPAGTGKPAGISKAKHRITSGLFALLAFLFIEALLQWLIPGGVFN